MNKIMLFQVSRKGQKFSQALYLDDGENEFLPRGEAISERQIFMLLNKGIEFLYTDGEQIAPKNTMK